MRTLLWVIVGLNQALLVIKSAITFRELLVSEFAFRERLGHHPGAHSALLRAAYKKLPLISTLRQLSLVINGSLSIALLTWLVEPAALGFFIAVLGFLVAALLSKVAFLQQLADKLFDKNLEYIMQLTNTFSPLLRLVGNNQRPGAALPSSQAEFTDQLRRMPSTVLQPLQRQRIESILAAENKLVKDIMTIKKRVVTVDSSATLGPVLLADLQKSGHGYFPVVDSGDSPVGILTLGDVSDIHMAKKRRKIQDLVVQHIAWVTEDMTLYDLARYFLAEKQYIILVKDSDGAFSGVVTIADFMKQVLLVVKEDNN